MSPTILCALLASGLAVALSREHRIRRVLAVRVVHRLLIKQILQDKTFHSPAQITQREFTSLHKQVELIIKFNKEQMDLM